MTTRQFTYKAPLLLAVADNATSPVPEGSYKGVMVYSTITNKMMMWDGTKWNAQNKVDSVAGQTGTVTLAKSDVGLSSVDNVSAASLRDRTTHTGEQPISSVTGLQTAINGRAALDHSHTEATTSLKGFMSSADKAKLDGIVPANLVNRANHTGEQAISTVTGLQAAIDGRASAGHSHSEATSSAGGFMSRTDKAKLDALNSATLLDRANHTGAQAIATITGLQGALDTKASTGHTHSNATTSVAGFMSNTDKSKLDAIAAGANNYVHPANHPASIITQDANNRFVTDTEKASWSAKLDTIKTVNGQSLVGSGDVVISGGVDPNTPLVLNQDATINGMTIGRAGATQSTAVGRFALSSPVKGGNNVAIGDKTMWGGNVGSGNVAVGVFALGNAGSNNVAVGLGAMTSATTSASNNVAIGDYALSINAGQNNTALGTNSLKVNTIGNNNTAIGARAMTSSGGSNNDNIVIGVDTAAGSELNNSIIIGNDSATNLSSVTSCVIIGNSTAKYNDWGSTLQNVILIAPQSGVPVYDVLNNSENRNSNMIVLGDSFITKAYIQVPWTVISDARDKTNFQDIPHGLEFVKQLKPTSYQFRESRESEETNGGVRYGFKAQDIAAIEPEGVVVDTSNPEKYYYNESNLIPILVKAIQELSAEIERLKNANSNH